MTAMNIIHPHQIIDAQTMFSQLEEARYTVSAGTVIYKGKINEKLQERTDAAYEEIQRFLGEESLKNLCGYDYELYCFSNTAAIYRAEKTAGLEKTIYDAIEYVDGFEEIYVRLRQFFRRIQLGDGEAAMPMYRAFVEEHHLSVFCLGILFCNVQVGNKDRVAGFLIDQYMEEGRREEAETFLKILCGLPLTEGAILKTEVAAVDGETVVKESLSDKGANIETDVATAEITVASDGTLLYVPVSGEAGERLKSRLEAMRA